MSIFKSEWNRIFIIISVILFAKIADAFGGDVVIEPYIGMVHGEYNSKNDSTKHQYDSFSFGSKAGYRYMGFDGGLDFTFSTPTMEQRMPIENNPSKTDYFRWGIGPYIAYQFPILLRVWGTYFLHSSYTARSGDRNDTLSGSGYALGVGYQLSFIPKVDVFLNLEMRRLTISKVEGSGDSKINDTENPITELMLSLSIPFGFNMDVSFN
ncbi:MAG: hypothetical protein KAG61_04690 [Bacteriovoracaceae bacterium]|nr:hypothetical protein [Bacteriovoracaceae bacterium]